MPSNPRYLAALQGEQLKRVAERSFPAFVRQAWPILEPTTAFLPNWHIDLVCEYLEAVTAGEIRRLVINLPPRYGKSLLVSVLWPVWEWIRHPATRWVFTSYAESLAGQHSQDRRTLLQSSWYCGHWGPRVSLTHPTEASEYWNAQRGRMLATSVGAAVTGKGGNRIVVDDPHTPLGAESDAQRHRVIEYFRRSVATRLDDKQRGAIVVVMQRLHAQDLTATCLDLGYTPLCLPAEATSRTTITFPRSGRVVTRAPGDLLWPAREGPEEMAQRRVELGAYGFAGQYQQSPSPRTGGLFERRWWAFYDDLPTGVDAGIQSWDLSVKGGPGHDFVVGLVAARRGADIYLVDRVKAQLSFPDTLAAIRQTCRQYPSARTILVEDTANGPAVIDTLRHEIPGIIAVQPQGDKVQRATACAPRVEAGNVYLPRPTGPNGRRLPARAWVDDFIEQVAAFPMGAHDDDVDAFTQLLLRWHPRRMSPEMMRRILRAGSGSLPPRRHF